MFYPDRATRSGIMTVEGTFFDYDDLENNRYSIYSIAVSLSNTCRYVGQLEDFYSVAQHSVMVSHIVPPDQALAGLLHDAPEAFLHDVNKPLKRRVEMIAYEALYQRVEWHMFKKFKVPSMLTPEIHHADAVMLVTERRDLRAAPVPVNSAIRPLPDKLVPLAPKPARDLFLARYLELTADWKPE
jgi:hypothetical protein